MYSRSIRFLIIAIVVAAFATFGVLRYGNVLRDQQADDAASPAVTLPDLPVLAELLVASDEPRLDPSRLRSALAARCADEARQPEPEPTPDQLQAQADEFEMRRRDILRQLKSSPSSEHLLFSTFLEKSPVQKVALVQSALLQNPSDALLLWHAVQICTAYADTSGCPLREWEQRLSDLDGHNSETWMRIAANRHREGDEESAMDAMRKAATSPSTSIFWTETIAMSERSLSASSDLSFPERAGMAFGLAATNLPRFGDFVNMCETKSEQITDWTFTCLDYGRLAEDQSKTDIGVSIALAIQNLALAALGDESSAAAATARHDKHKEKMRDLFGAIDLAAVEHLVFSSPALFYAYLEMIRTHGESGARSFLADEVNRLLEQQPELACTPEGR